MLLHAILAAVLAALGPFISPLRTLNSVQPVDDHPLYIMHYYGDLDENIAIIEGLGRLANAEGTLPARPAGDAWACSLFVTFAGPDGALFGRNFDWHYSPAVLLFNHPPDGYESVAMVDIAYLGYDRHTAGDIPALSLGARANLIYAPLLPFDGMNEHGLAIGMAAVPPQQMPHDPARPTIDSLAIMREVLDHARTVEEAVALFEAYNIDMAGGPPVHYLVADRTGGAVLIEFVDGAMVVQPAGADWHAATNFLNANAGDQPELRCSRYRLISRTMQDRAGALAADAALALLAEVAQSNTQWSVVYHLGDGALHVVMGRAFDAVHSARLPVGGGEHLQR